MAAEAAATITQLEAARQVVLTDATHYGAVIPGVLPIIGANALLDVRRWGADFLAESFASTALSLQAKESLGIQVLPLMHELLEPPSQDEAIVKSIIQAAASSYGPVFRHMYVAFLNLVDGSSSTPCKAVEPSNIVDEAYVVYLVPTILKTRKPGHGCLRLRRIS